MGNHGDTAELRCTSVDYNEKLNHGVTSCYTMVYQVCRMG